MKLHRIAHVSDLARLVEEVATLVVRSDLDLLSDQDLTLLVQHRPVLAEAELLGAGAAALKNLGQSALASLRRKLQAVAGSDSPWAETIKQLGISRFIAGLRRYGGEFLRWAAFQPDGGHGYGRQRHDYGYWGRRDDRSVDRRIKDMRDELVRALRGLLRDRRKPALKEILAELMKLDNLP
jgi:hypothetical protein